MIITFFQVNASQYSYKYVSCSEIHRYTCSPIDGHPVVVSNPSLSARQSTPGQPAALPLSPSPSKSVPNGSVAVKQAKSPAGGHSMAATNETSSLSEVVLVVLHSNSTGEPIVRRCSYFCTFWCCWLLVSLRFEHERRASLQSCLKPQSFTNMSTFLPPSNQTF